MKLVIVTGLSGSGKTIVLNSLEDMGISCVDNLPVGLLPAFIEHINNQQNQSNSFAVGVDARTITEEYDVKVLLKTLSVTTIPYQILFIEADNRELLKRFSETRRKHPLTRKDLSLEEAVKYERQLIEPLAEIADLRINTSHTHIHQLRNTIHKAIELRPKQGLSLLFRSFGFKHGIPFDTDFVFDVRCLPNPHWEKDLKKFTGRDNNVIEFLQQYPKVDKMYQHILNFLETWIPEFVSDNRSYLTVAIGCTGGQHRSVYLAEQLAQHFSEQQKYGVLVRHRELGIQEIRN